MMSCGVSSFTFEKGHQVQPGPQHGHRGNENENENEI